LLLEEGHDVVVIDSFMYDQNALLYCATHPKLRILRGDVRNHDFVLQYLQDADVIIPLAALVGAPLCSRDPISATGVNYDAIKFILEHRKAHQKIIFPTTNSGYGIGEEGKECTEESALRPVSLYGRLKVDIENELLASGNTVTFRLATVFGVSPRMRLDLLVNDFTHRAVRDRFVVLFEPHFKRNYISVLDAARAFVHALKNFDAMKNNAFNVGLSDANLSKMELCEAIRSVVKEFDIQVSEIGKDPDKRNYIVSNAKIEATGFKPQLSLMQGIEQLVDVFRFLQTGRYTNI
jgi:nucleoside-diphosphate-sugar epimerase